MVARNHASNNALMCHPNSKYDANVLLCIENRKRLW